MWGDNHIVTSGKLLLIMVKNIEIVEFYSSVVNKLTIVPDVYSLLYSQVDPVELYVA